MTKRPLMRFQPGIVLLILVPLSGCLIASADPAELAKADECGWGMTQQEIPGSEWVVANGTLKWIELEGGFWAIETDEGRKLQLITEVCDDLREDGLRIHFEGRTRPDMGGVHMWGEYLELGSIARA